VIGKLKDGKAMGMNKMSNKVWRYGEAIEEWILCNKI